MVCKYDKTHDNGTEMHDRAPSTGPGLRQPGLGSSRQQLERRLWTQQAPSPAPRPRGPYLLSDAVELNYL